MALPLLGAGPGSAVAAISPWASFDGSNTNATITNLGLTATHSNSSLGGARSASAKNSGLYYFEITGTTLISSSCLGLLTAAGTYTNFVVNGTNCVAIYQGGAIWSNGANSTKTLGALSNGDIIGIAMDFGNAKVWARKSPSGNWNGDAAANPATNTNGISTSSFSATTLTPAVGWSNASGGDDTANFGLGSFSGTTPSGFTAGWPV